MRHLLSRVLPMPWHLVFVTEHFGRTLLVDARGWYFRGRKLRVSKEWVIVNG